MKASAVFSRIEETRAAPYQRQSPRRLSLGVFIDRAGGSALLSKNTPRHSEFNVASPKKTGRSSKKDKNSYCLFICLSSIQQAKSSEEKCLQRFQWASKCVFSNTRSVFPVCRQPFWGRHRSSHFWTQGPPWKKKIVLNDVRVIYTISDIQICLFQ